jgi:predicted nucleotidyltransferase component of viral defense system
MLNIREIEKYYPAHLHSFKRFMLREYLQYKILEIIFDGPYADRLIFLGGTCLRIVHGNQRFSEDLDFDNLHLKKNEFLEITNNISKQLSRQGYDIEMKPITKTAFHCYIKFPGMLFKQGLSGYNEEKILIQLDTEAQDFNYDPSQPILNKFDVFTKIKSTPLSLLMSQKCYAILNRPRNKGRDFFDLVFLMGMNIEPNMDYLEQKINIKSKVQLKKRLLSHCQKLNMKEMAEDVSPFLFNPQDEKKILLFPEYIESVEF